MGSMRKKWCSLSVRNSARAGSDDTGRHLPLDLCSKTCGGPSAKTGLFVKTSSRGVRRPDLEKHGTAVCLAGGGQEGFQKPLSKAFPAGSGGDDNVFQFPFRGKVLGHQEA